MRWMVGGVGRRFIVVSIRCVGRGGSVRTGRGDRGGFRGRRLGTWLRGAGFERERERREFSFLSIFFLLEMERGLMVGGFGYAELGF